MTTTRNSTVTDVKQAQLLLSSSDFVPPDLSSFLMQLQRESGADLSLLVEVSRHLLLFTVGPAHKQSRRFLAPLLSQSSLVQFDDDITSIVSELMAQLAVKRKSIDVVKDIEWPLYTMLVNRLFSFKVTSDFQSVISSAIQIVEPLQSLKSLLSIQTAYRTLIKQSSAALENRPDDSYCASLCRSYENIENKEGVNLPMLLLSLVIASKAVAETMTNIIVDNQNRFAVLSSYLADPVWVSEHIDTLIHQSASTEYIVREAAVATNMGSVLVDERERCMVHVPTLNKLCQHKRSLSFGGGVRRCPGDNLAKTVLRKLIPRLFSQYPQMTVVKKQIIRQNTSLTRRYSQVPLNIVKD